MQAKYHPPAPSIQFYFTTECGRNFQWAAVSMDSLLREVTEKGLRIKEVRTMDEQKALEASIELGKAYIERELKESA
ncbi:hypothetical protein NYE44_01475 [Paenibacillus sp. FSL L8-0493]|uniref:hypothetical protein n=1 Tax=Paenibacillus sp. FSL L8-0493 TaxID=2975333 RepID=UPI0030FD4CA9